METDFWTELTIAVVGGDEREQEISRQAATTGASVNAYGFPWPEGGIVGVKLTTSVAEAMGEADFLLLPIPRAVGGQLYAPQAAAPIRIQSGFFSPLRAGAHVFCGRITPELADAATGEQLTLHEYDPDRKLMLERASAIVEGALETAIGATEETLNHSPVAVVGYGNIGSLLARRLLALGAKVTVVARNPLQRAAARAAGATSVDLDELASRAHGLRMVFSTVPAAVVDRDVLKQLPRGSLVLDIVPPPARSELEDAERLGHRAVWARGLGRRAPKTVGRSQWQGVMQRIQEIQAARVRGAHQQQAI